jgi:MFS transporter, PPP family, 3-phenylpropionic acid transporter
LPCARFFQAATRRDNRQNAGVRRPLNARPRPDVAVIGLMVLFGVGAAAFFPFFSLWLKDRGLDPGDIGLVVGVMALGRIATNPVWGHVADSMLGRRDALRLSLVATVVTAFALSLVGGTLGWVVVTAFLLAAASCAIGPSIDAIALEHLGEENVQGYGRIRAWMSVGYAVASLGLGILLQLAGVSWAIPVFGMVAAVVLVWTLTVRRDTPRHTASEGRFGSVGAALRGAPRLWAFLAAVLILWTGFSAAWNFLGLRIESEGGGPLLIGLGAALGGVAEVPIMRFSSRLSGVIGLRGVFAAGCGVYATAFLLWGIVNNAVAISLLTVMEGIGFALLYTSLVVIVGRLVPSSLYATGQSIATTVAFGVATLIGGTVGGWVYENVGALAVYGGASVCALGAAVIAWVSLNAPAFTRHQKIETPIAPPPGPAAGV